jgi:hypothetical protein
LLRSRDGSKKSRTYKTSQNNGWLEQQAMKLKTKLLIQNLKNPASPLQTTLLTLFAALVYLLRAHPYFFKPQLYAEDGSLWLADGHNKPWYALFRPDNGFFHFAEHLFGLIVVHLPLLWAPALFAWTAWVLFIIMVYYLLSSRTKILTNNFERFFLVLALCLIANFGELFFNFSNSVFLMGITGALILVAKRPNNRIVSIAEKAFFLLTCSTLLFAWFYLPLALIDRFKYKAKNNFFLFTSLFASIAQALCYLLTHANRSPVTLLSLFSKYTLLELYNQIIIPAVRFARIDIPVSQFSTSHYPVYVVFLAVAALAVATIAVIRRGNRQLWFLLFFLAAMTFASFKSPTITVQKPVDAIKIMAAISGGNRYFVYGILATNLIFIKSVYGVIVPRARYIFMTFFVALGLITSLHYQVFFINKGWADYTSDYQRGIAAYYNKNVKGQVVILENPTPWKMALDKQGAPPVLY